MRVRVRCSGCTSHSCGCARCAGAHVALVRVTRTRAHDVAELHHRVSSTCIPLLSQRVLKPSPVLQEAPCLRGVKATKGSWVTAGVCLPTSSQPNLSFAADAKVHKRVTRVCGRGCSSSLPVRVLTCDDDDGDGEASEDDTNGDDAADTDDEVEGDGERDCISSCHAAGNSTATTCMPRCISPRPQPT